MQVESKETKRTRSVMILSVKVPIGFGVLPADSFPNHIWIAAAMAIHHLFQLGMHVLLRIQSSRLASY